MKDVILDDVRDHRLRAIHITPTGARLIGSEKRRRDATERLVDAIMEGDAKEAARLLRASTTLHGMLLKAEQFPGMESPAKDPVIGVGASGSFLVIAIAEPDKNARHGEKDGRGWAVRAADLVERMGTAGKKGKKR